MAKPGTESSAAAQPAGSPNAFIHLNDGSQVAGSIVASSLVDMVVAGADAVLTSQLPVLRKTRQRVGQFRK